MAKIRERTRKNGSTYYQIIYWYQGSRRKLLTENPCAHTKLPRVVQTEMHFLEPDEFAALPAALPERWRLLVEFLIASGARWGEVTALRVRDINRKNLTARIHKAWKYTGNKPVLGAPKTLVLKLCQAPRNLVFTNRVRG
ncbi:hypothetical protein [Nocardia sp. NPDC051570]|uniref:hypothetical protein n=1 Tax=Nocardia sp. NPDC051570 TaxID=3364324 RepID=UPI00379E2799